ncbi:MAG: LytTR family DNA-binding domain-containing protein [Bacillus sp. (in: Bacteria)]|nr:LytTR family DNA-binding domain-containing protein [Bacillus sp. (in: firmicutes)]MCM1426695.1 LytTR family DNA-binding domain-containing protein [Eubacterium sp.]
MRIAICDDEKAQQELLQKYLKEWAAQTRTPLETVLFPGAEAFLFAWEDDKNYDLLILDIEMGAVSGMELAGNIRRQNEDIPILFVTGYEKYMAQGYEVAALHYLLKPVHKDKFFSVMDKLKQKKKPEEKQLFRTENGSLSLPVSKIWYVEARAHRCILYTADAEYVLLASISETAQYLEKHSEFIRCHRSYLVNIRHTAAIIKTDLILDDKRRLPVSRSAQKKVNQAFLTFYHR